MASSGFALKSSRLLAGNNTNDEGVDVASDALDCAHEAAASVASASASAAHPAPTPRAAPRHAAPTPKPRAVKKGDFNYFLE